MRESLPPSGGSGPSAHGVGSYSYVAPVGSVAEESIRGNRPAQPVALNGREARELASAVQPAGEASVPAKAGEPNAAHGSAAKAEAPEKSAAARAPRLSLVTPDASVPSMIIDMGDHVNALVESLLRAAPTDSLAEIPELVKQGESVLPVLMQHFPGPALGRSHAASTAQSAWAGPLRGGSLSDRLWGSRCAVRRIEAEYQ